MFCLDEELINPETQNLREKKEKKKPSDSDRDDEEEKRLRKGIMVVRLRLSRFGCKNKPFYRVMAADSRSPRDGKHLEVLGYYNPLPGNEYRLLVEVEFGLSLFFPAHILVFELKNLLHI